MTITALLICLAASLTVLLLWGARYKGAIAFSLAMRYAGLCIFIVLSGCLTAIPWATAPMTLHFAQASAFSAHFHYFMSLFLIYGVFGLVYFFFPAVTGRTADNGIAKLAFWLNLAGTQATFWPLYIVRVDGMPRRYWDYGEQAAAADFTFWHRFATYGAFITAADIALMIGGWGYSIFAGQRVERKLRRSKPPGSSS